MNRQNKIWKRNVEGLRKSAQEKSIRTKHRVEEAIRLLVKERQPITFNAVAQTAQVSTAWLYADEDIKMRIIYLRSQQKPKAKIGIPPEERASDASKERIIAALQKRVAKQAEEIEKLNEKLEIAYGQLRHQYLQD
jgi:hypothetical protein